MRISQDVRERYGAARGEGLGADEGGGGSATRDLDAEIDEQLARKAKEFVDLGATIYVREPAER